MPGTFKFHFLIFIGKNVLAQVNDLIIVVHMAIDVHITCVTRIPGASSRPLDDGICRSKLGVQASTGDVHANLNCLCRNGDQAAASLIILTKTRPDFAFDCVAFLR